MDLPKYNKLVSSAWKVMDFIELYGLRSLIYSKKVGDLQQILQEHHNLF